MSFSHLGDMDESFFAGEIFNKCTECHELRNRGRITFTRLRITNDTINDFGCLIGTVLIGTENKDSTIVFDINLNFIVGNNLIDGLATLTDDFADLLGINFDLHDLWSLILQIAARLGNDGIHAVIENPETTTLSHCKSLTNYIHRYAVDFHIDLDPRYAFGCTRNFEVHVTIEIFNAENIHENGEISIVIRCQQTC